MKGQMWKINERSVPLPRSVTRYVSHVQTDSKGHQERPTCWPHTGRGGKHVKNHLQKRMFLSQKGRRDRPVTQLDFKTSPSEKSKRALAHE